MSNLDSTPVAAVDSSQHQCIICHLPNEADRKMVQCDGCSRWYHFTCVGVNDSIEGEDRSFLCVACTLPGPTESIASTSTSAREARLQLEMQRLAEEKLLQERMQEEREKQEKEMQEMALRLERDRRDKAITAMFALEKDYIKKKYNLLHTQLDDEGDAASVRSRRNYNQSTSKVQEWITRNPPATLSANTGSIPTGLTLQTETTSCLVQMTSETTTAGAGTSLALSATSTVSGNAIPMHVTNSSSVLPLISSTPTSLQQVFVPPLSSMKQQASPISPTVMQWNQGRPITTPVITMPSSTMKGANDAFVISPTTMTSNSYPLSSVPPAYIPSYMQNPTTLPSAPNKPLQPQVSSSPRPTLSHPSVAPSSSISVYMQSGIDPSVCMPAPSYHSTPTRVPIVDPPGARRVSFAMQPVSTQSIPGMQSSNPMLRQSKYTSPNVMENSAVRQYIPPMTAVSGRYYEHDLRESNQNYVYNPWVSVTNCTPPSSLAQYGSLSNPLLASLSDGNWGQNGNLGYQGHEVYQPVLSCSQPASTGTRMVANSPSVTNVRPINVQDFPSPPETFRVPNVHQLAARQVVPKDLPSFGGNPAEWPLFWSSFETSTQMCGYTEAENLLRLQRCLNGEARKAVSSFLLHPSNVGEIVSTLRMLYGRPDAIIGTLLNDVRSTPTPKPEKLETLVNFGLVVRNFCAHLVSAGQEMHLANPILLQELVDKLPANIKLGWAMHKQSVLVEDIRAFYDYMNIIINAASSVSSGLLEGTKPERQKGKAFVNSVRSDTNPESSEKCGNGDGETLGESQSAAVSKVRPCAVCQTAGHKPKDCPTFKAKKLDDRWKAVHESHLCKRCLYPHGRWPCKAPVCGTDGCQEHHHRFLHPGNPQEGGNSRSPTATTSTGVVTVHKHQHQKILFRIIPVSLHANGKTVKTFAFLDGGSDSTLLETSIAEELGVTGPVLPLCMQWTNGVKRTEEDSRRVQLEISGSNSNKRFLLSGVHTVSSLDLPQQTVDFNELQAKYAHLKGLPVSSYDGAVPRLLIGLDNTKIKTPLKLREGKGDEPVAAKTRLGWTLYGRSGNATVNLSHRVMHVCNRPTNDELHEMVKTFFTVDGAGVGANELVESIDEKRARELMETTTVRTSTGKFQTGLLWKHDKVKFPDSRPMAERRLQCLEKRLSKDPKLYEKVREQLADYVAKGYAHRATEQELKETDPSQVWYLPLGVVTNPKKPEKVRVVWDAAASVKGVSLNSVLLKGPDLLQSLPTVLCRFRQKEVAINADIKEMFHQVFIRPEDRQALRFLWRNNPSEPVQVFVMDVAIFGSTCSPSSAQFVKNLNASQHSEEFPRAATAVVENHYVDDYLDSVDTVDEAVQLAEEVKTVHERGGFELRHWLSNSPEVLKRIGEKSSETTKNFVMGKGSGAERVLGMTWLPQEDVFSFAIRFRSDLERLLDGCVYPTKRELLSLVMSIFDPLGLVANFVVHGKILVQDVWRSGIGWDEKIPEVIFPLWSRWVKALQDLGKVRIERCYFPGYDPKAFETVELHVFVDASMAAYAAAAYFRIVDRGAVRCTLVASKTKVAPLKQLSVPRLELQAAVIGTRLMKTITASHTLPIRRKIFWSDSNTVLAWLRSDQQRFHQFVAFRVGEILEESNVSEWRKVPTRWNVSDEATKWGNGPIASERSRWLRGPEFLYKDERDWPEQEVELTTSEEMRTVNIHRLAVAGETIEFKRFSKWERLLRTVGYVRRFRDNCLKKKSKLPFPDPEILSREELQEAELTVLKLIQREAFADEYAKLESNHQVPVYQQKMIEKNSRIFKLCPFLGIDGVMRKDGRIGAAPWLSDEAKFPAILPKNHYVTSLIIDSYHRKFGHANNETVVNELRQRFHVSELRAAVGKVAKKCWGCKVRKTMPQPPRMSPLPETRLTPYVRPFTFTGLDYFGPISIRCGRGCVKRWVALFTCLTTRAVHLEIAFTLTTESCKLAVRRFIARRGAPLEIYSDQGTNFQGARKELQQEVSKMNRELVAAFTNAATQWKLNPPYARHMGGIWERLVRSVKTALAAMEMSRNPDEETLITALAEAESMVNSRPLTYLPLDSVESEALTPNHFLLLSSNGVCQPIAAPLNDASAMRSNWKHVQVMLDRFWNRWIKEYLPVISRQSKWFGEMKPIRIGDLVMIVNEVRRNSWERGIVVKTYPGKDGRIRSVDVRTASGIIQRPLTKLAILDVLEHDGMAEGTSSNTGRGMCATVQDPPSTTIAADTYSN